MIHPSCLIIAGSDSSAGAGIQADLKTFSYHNVYASTCFTALTAQNTQGVDKVVTVSPDFIEEQIKSITKDLKIKFIKIGMLSNVDSILAIEKCIKKYLKGIPIILDPVMVAKGGHTLLEEDAIDFLIKKIIPKSFLITPNLPEAEKILQTEMKNKQQMQANIKNFRKLGIKNVLLKGGHLGEKSENILDLLLENSDINSFESPFIKTNNTHGTGCSLASALTSNLFLGESLYTSTKNARNFVFNGIKKSFKIGHGHSPINHFRDKY